MSSTRRSVDVRRAGGAFPRTRRGCGSKVRATGTRPRAFASAVARANRAWCPRWTPSKFPVTTTAPRARSGASTPSPSSASSRRIGCGRVTVPLYHGWCSRPPRCRGGRSQKSDQGVRKMSAPLSKTRFSRPVEGERTEKRDPPRPDRTTCPFRHRPTDENRTTDPFRHRPTDENRTSTDEVHRWTDEKSATRR